MVKTIDKIDALIFIDTNILLDFYRIRKSDISLKYLQEMENHKGILILTNQVEMEFRKNRQKVILETIAEVNKISAGNLNIPTILSDAKPVEMLRRAQRQIATQQKKIKERIDKLLANPGTQDKVFQTLQKIFKTPSEYNLNRDNNKRFTIRRLALRRFYLGYPPRKNEDNSIGDAINWEWIIDCASRTDKHIILVTRDCDFGIIYGENSYLNDWLQIEFKERISQKRKIILTDKLSTAFKLVEIPVTTEMIEEENTIISERIIESEEQNEMNEYRVVRNRQRLKLLQEYLSNNYENK
ncbi:MAG: PIN domain-containing protein [Bacteroidales bacterium]|nr:PIN domain-containing protein [Bacteroidales bacterium]